MAEKIQKKSAEAAIRSKIYVDDQYIYLQAEYGAENMYIVLKRV